jgi:hypothetical protein
MEGCAGRIDDVWNAICLLLASEDQADSLRRYLLDYETLFAQYFRELHDDIIAR